MAQTELHSSNQDLDRREAQLRDELQIISMVLYLVNPELLSDQVRIRSFVGLGQSALDRVVDILDRCAPHSWPNNPAKIVVMKAALQDSNA